MKEIKNKNKVIVACLIAILVFITFSTVTSQDLPDFNQIRKDFLKNKKSIELTYEMGTAFPKSEFDSTYYYGELLYKRGIKEDSDSAKYLGMLLKGRAFFNELKFDSSKLYFRNFISQVKEKPGFSKYYFSAKNLYCLSLWRSHHVEEAKNGFESLLNELISAGNEKMQIGVRGNLGVLYRQLGDYNSAIKNFELLVSLDKNNPFSVANAYFNIGTMYSRLHKFDQADEAYNKALGTKNIRDEFRISLIGNKANNFSIWGKKDSAEYYYRKAVKLSESIPDHPASVVPYLELSKIYLQKKNFREAKKLSKEALRISQKLHDRVQTMLSNMSIVKLYFATGKFYRSINLADSVINFANNNRLGNMLQDTYKIISMAYDSLGNTGKALSYLKKHADFQDRMRNYVKDRTKIDMRARYNIGQMEEKVAQNKKTQKYGLIMLSIFSIGIFLLVSLSLIVIKKYKSQKSVSNQLLEEKQEHKLIIEKLTADLREIEKQETEDDGFIFVNNKRIEFKNIIHITSSGHYLYYHLLDKSSHVIERKNLKDILELLPANQFVQIHRSNIINIRHIKSFSLQDVALVNDNVIKMSRTYKNNLYELVNRN